jgi:hypothetical protein
MEPSFLKRFGILSGISAVLFLFIISTGCVSEDGTLDNTTDDLQVLEFSNYLGITDTKDTFLVVGSAENTGDLPIQRVQLRIDYLDSSHALVASRTYDETVVILPGDTWNFEFPFTDPAVTRIVYYYISPLRIEYVT